jgi:trehalose 6-phosphate phosphatase
VPYAHATAARELAASPERTALMLDFDGSLAPIVDRPEQATAYPASLAALTRLAPRFAVTVVSGRPVDFLVQRIPVAGVRFVGAYGIERWIDGERVVDPRVVPFLDAIAAAADEAEARLPEIFVERKGGVAVTLHWRRASSVADAAIRLAAELAETYGLDHPLRGRMAVELRPPVPIDKGTAVEGVIAGFDFAAFAGDDAGDLPAFDALDRAVAEHRLARAFRVAVESPEAPPAVVARADVVVTGPAALADFLSAVADAADPSRSPV